MQKPARRRSRVDKNAGFDVGYDAPRLELELSPVASKVALLAVTLVILAAPTLSTPQTPPATPPTVETSSAPTPSSAVTVPPEAASPPEAPFGLTWLASKEALAGLGIRFKSPMDTEFGASYVAAQLPKELPDLHYAILSFGDDDRLIRITAVGTGFDHDDDGDRVKARYTELDELLQKKYGAGKPEYHVEKNCDGDNFARCLGMKRNWMYTSFSPPDMRIELSVFVDLGQTRWRMIFEYVPGMDRLERARKQEEERAF